LFKAQLLQIPKRVLIALRGLGPSHLICHREHKQKGESVCGRDPKNK
jgi:hypothetical protein